jgi:hypothetical protein
MEEIMESIKVNYEQDGKVAYFDGHRFVRDDKTGYYLSSHKIGGKRKRLHVYVWEYYNGSVPRGSQIHHADEDKSHNEIDNLKCLSEHDHLSYHSKQMMLDEEFKKVFHDRGIEAAKEWHGSPVGHRWHKAHYDRMKDKLYVPYDCECQYCGKKYISTNKNSKFCCNAHKTYARRESGVDNIEAACVICGKPFIKNKYDKTQTCSVECRTELKRSRKRP